MKKQITFILLFIALIGTALYSRLETESNLYPATFTVIATDKETDTLTLEDFNGNIWIYEGIEDWLEGDTAAALMNSNGTPTIYDDSIIQLRYTGYFY